MNALLKVLVLLVFMPFLVIADDHSTEVISDSWVMVPKPGHQDKFEAALKEHMKYRKENGDTRSWQTYQPVVGNHLNRYIVRHCCSPWADQDKYVAWSSEKMSKHFDETIAPHVQEYMHNFYIIDMENSNWPANTKANYVGVTTYKSKPGKASDRNASIKQMSSLAKEKKWPRAWSWTYPVGGESSWSLAVPFENYADMAPMEESFYEFTMKHMDSAEEVDAMFDKFSSSFTSSSYSIYKHSKELSMPMK